MSKVKNSVAKATSPAKASKAPKHVGTTDCVCPIGQSQTGREAARINAGIVAWQNAGVLSPSAEQVYDVCGPFDKGVSRVRSHLNYCKVRSMFDDKGRLCKPRDIATNGTGYVYAVAKTHREGSKAAIAAQPVVDVPAKGRKGSAKQTGKVAPVVATKAPRKASKATKVAKVAKAGK
jgi:hypothetical protein